jgi:5'-deoxynucleotidase YfbR-like HD superfamily hydrolase
MHDTWIQTYTGKRFTPFDPQMEDIDIQDIAEGLSKECRFAGQISQFYSVAEHSVRVSWLLAPRLLTQEHKTLALYGLLHDASEAYMKDMPKPIKDAPGMEFYRAAHRLLQATIYNAFGLSSSVPQAVKQADMQMLVSEAHALLPFGPVDDWARAATGIEPQSGLAYDLNVGGPMPTPSASYWFMRRFEAVTR